MVSRGCLVLIALTSGTLALADEPKLDGYRLEASLQAAIGRAEPAIACVQVFRARDTAPDPSRPQPEPTRSAPPDFYGSGVVIDPSGLVLTCYHVVRDEKNIQRIAVRLPPYADNPSREYSAIVYASDYRSDLAVLKLQAAGPFPALAVGRGEDLRKGSMVLALGHPYAAGFRDGSASASWGIVGNLRRRLPAGTNELDRDKPFAAFGTLVQTDARLQLGSSGGALVNLDGKLVGVTTATAAISGVEAPGGYAVPLDANTRRIVDVLMRGEEVEYGFLGVNTADDLFRGRRYTGPGVQLTTVAHNSPASRAGLMIHDVILKVNGQPIRDRDDLFLALGASLAGRRAELLIRSGETGREQIVSVVLAKSASKYAKNVVTNRPTAYGGLRVDYTSVADAGDKAIPEGVVVRESQGHAKAAGLTENDIITEVNGQPVNSPVEYYRMAEKASKAGDSLRLTLRGTPARTVTLPW
ncbi:MAG: trypsin-like peptidase domain-containing protein [Gemmataceae bacterium]